MDHLSKLLDWVEGGASVSTDTRSLKKGDIFFALKGEKFDGNRYASMAMDKGARVAVIDDESYTKGKGYFLVDNVLTTLQELAVRHRLKFDIPLIGITGSNGKTTTKELLYSALKGTCNVLATEGNFNNHIGVPLTLLKLNDQHDMAIVEMGASRAGEIADLCEIARPTSGLVTNVGKAHIEGFGSEEVICATKAGLYDYLAAHGGLSFIPQAIAQHPYFEHREYEGSVYFQAASMAGNEVTRVSMEEAFPFIRLKVKCAVDTIAVQTQLYGDYNFDNLVNIIKIADYYSVPCQEWMQGLKNYVPGNNRSQLMEDEKGNTIILDAYNANPSSVNHALKHFLALEGDRGKVIILGDMLELGKIAEEEHLKVVRELASESGIQVALVGSLFREAFRQFRGEKAHIKCFENTIKAKEWWLAQHPQGKLVLVKGSRGIALETLFA
jgi:UDP-N-acetylmuramoyl-tripeptide--D-alanyl-D-alanine ligase